MRQAYMVTTCILDGYAAKLDWFVAGYRFITWYTQKFRRHSIHHEYVNGESHCITLAVVYVPPAYHFFYGISIFTEMIDYVVVHSDLIIAGAGRTSIYHFKCIGREEHRFTAFEVDRIPIGQTFKSRMDWSELRQLWIDYFDDLGSCIQIPASIVNSPGPTVSTIRKSTYIILRAHIHLCTRLQVDVFGLVKNNRLAAQYLLVRIYYYIDWYAKQSEVIVEIAFTWINTELSCQASFIAIAINFIIG